MSMTRGIAGLAAGAGGILRPAARLRLPAPRFRLDYACFGPDGRLKWRGTGRNLVTTAGLDHALEVLLKDGTQVATWYLGLVNDAAPDYALADTLASHAGWAEGTAYDGDRKAIAWGTIAGGEVSASAAASFAITGTMASLVGAFVASVASGSAGLLYSVADIDQQRAVANGDTLNITPTVSVANPA